MGVTGVLAAAGPVGADTKSELRRARDRLTEVIGRISDESAVLGRLQAEAAALTARIDAVASRIESTQGRIADLQQRIRSAELALEARQNLLDARARAAYVLGPGQEVEFLLGSTSLGDLTERLEIVDRASQSDLKLINEIAGERRALDGERRRLAALQDDLVAAQAELERDEAALEAKLSSSQSSLARLRSDQMEADSLVRRLEDRLERERAAARLDAAQRAALAALRAARGGAVSIGGVFEICPVDQPNGYSDTFGAARWTGGYHPHAGVDIFAPTGTPIRAPFAGNAEEASNGIGGLSVKVYGRQGYVYNAHLSALGRLGPVEPGMIVGYVGDSGNASGGSPHNHFEWHPLRIPRVLHVSPYGASLIRDAVDPFPYLNAVC